MNKNMIVRMVLCLVLMMTMSGCNIIDKLFGKIINPIKQAQVDNQENKDQQFSEDEQDYYNNQLDQQRSWIEEWARNNSK